MGVSAERWDSEKPWERQPCDDDMSFAWYREFLALEPPRQLAPLLKRKGCPWDRASLIQRKDADMWDARASAWDTHLASIRDAAVTARVRETAEQEAERFADMAKTMGELALTELRKYLTTAQKHDGIGLVQVGQLVRLAEVSIKWGRILRGNATEIVQTQTGPDLSTLSVEELRALQQMSQKTAMGG